MTRIATYVFIDLETTGMPREEFNKTRITEMSMVAVKREHLLATIVGSVPRVMHKLSLCFNPRRLIADSCTTVTGLCNFLLEHETEFNMQVFIMIDNFLSSLTQPVCLVAQNGLKFDYPIFKNHIVKLKQSFSVEVLCTDCLHAFYHIDKSAERAILDKVRKMLMYPSSNGKQTPEKSSTKLVSSPLLNKHCDINKPTTSTETGNNNIIHQANVFVKSVNESTPSKKINPKSNSSSSKVKKRQFPWDDDDIPNKSYKLGNIYARELGEPAVDAHRAENDCIFTLKIAVKYGKKFVDWVDENHITFADIEPMTIGVPMQ